MYPGPRTQEFVQRGLICFLSMEDWKSSGNHKFYWSIFHRSLDLCVNIYLQNFMCWLLWKNDQKSRHRNLLKIEKSWYFSMYIVYPKKRVDGRTEMIWNPWNWYNILIFFFGGGGYYSPQKKLQVGSGYQVFTIPPPWTHPGEWCKDSSYVMRWIQRDGYTGLRAGKVAE